MYLPVECTEIVGTERNSWTFVPNLGQSYTFRVSSKILDFYLFRKRIILPQYIDRLRDIHKLESTFLSEVQYAQKRISEVVTIIIVVGRP